MILTFVYKDIGDPIIRNISYKELIRNTDAWCYTWNFKLEIYPIRNWYINYTKNVTVYSGLEIYPIRNWYANTVLLWILNACIRNISYKELIRLQRDSDLFHKCQLEIYPIRNWYTSGPYIYFNVHVIRNISYKELIQCQFCVVPKVEGIRNISYKELIPRKPSGRSVSMVIRNISYKELIRYCLWILFRFNPD